MKKIFQILSLLTFTAGPAAAANLAHTSERLPAQLKILLAEGEADTVIGNGGGSDGGLVEGPGEITEPALGKVPNPPESPQEDSQTTGTRSGA